MATKSDWISLGSSILTAIGSIAAGNATSDQKNFESQVTQQQSDQQANLVQSEADKQAQFLLDQTSAQADIYGQQAQRAKEIAIASEADYRLQQDRLFAERRANMGASGVRLDTGSPVLAAGDFAQEVELNARRIRVAGATDVQNLQQQGELIRNTGVTQAGLIKGAGKAQADLIRTAGSTNSTLLANSAISATRAGYFQAGASLLNGASNFT